MSELTYRPPIGKITRYPRRTTVKAECLKCDWQKFKRDIPAAQTAIREHSIAQHPAPIHVYLEDDPE